MAPPLDDSNNTTSHAKSTSTASAGGSGVTPPTPAPPVTNSHPSPVVVAPVPAPEPVPAQIEDFDSIIRDDVQKFVGLGNKIGGLVAEQVSSFLNSFTEC
jgi:adenylyl cyclase-associated protein